LSDVNVDRSVGWDDNEQTESTTQEHGARVDSYSVFIRTANEEREAQLEMQWQEATRCLRKEIEMLTLCCALTLAAIFDSDDKNNTPVPYCRAADVAIAVKLTALVVVVVLGPTAIALSPSRGRVRRLIVCG